MAPRTMRMFTRPGCEDSDAAREFLNRHGIAFEEINIENDPQAMRFVALVNDGKRRTPTFDLEGRTFHSSPFNARALARELGLNEDPS